MTLKTSQHLTLPSARREPGAAVTLGPWRAIGTTARVTATVQNGSAPPTTPCSFACDVSGDGGSTFTTLTAIAAGVAAETTYTLEQALTSSQGTSYRVRFSGNQGGEYVGVSAGMQGTQLVV